MNESILEDYNHFHIINTHVKNLVSIGIIVTSMSIILNTRPVSVPMWPLFRFLPCKSHIEPYQCRVLSCEASAWRFWQSVIMYEAPGGESIKRALTRVFTDFGPKKTSNVKRPASNHFRNDRKLCCAQIHWFVNDYEVCRDPKRLDGPTYSRGYLLVAKLTRGVSLDNIHVLWRSN